MWGDVTSVLYVSCFSPVVGLYCLCNRPPCQTLEALPRTGGGIGSGVVTLDGCRHTAGEFRANIDGAKSKLYRRRFKQCLATPGQHAYDRNCGSSAGGREGDNELFISCHLVMLAALSPYSTRQRMEGCKSEHDLQPQQLWTPSGHGCRTCFRKQGASWLESTAPVGHRRHLSTSCIHPELCMPNRVTGLDVAPEAKR